MDTRFFSSMNLRYVIERAVLGVLLHNDALTLVTREIPPSTVAIYIVSGEFVFYSAGTLLKKKRKTYNRSFQFIVFAKSIIGKIGATSIIILISRCCKASFCFGHQTEIQQDSIVPHKLGNSSKFNKMCPFGV